jgi:hypothetical protein
MKKLTYLQTTALVKKADSLFNRAANAWIHGNNSGSNEIVKQDNAKCDRLRREAETLLKPLGIVVDYPGLYPSFTVRGYEYHSTASAVSAALEPKRR